jgi:erythromycin esterase
MAENVSEIQKLENKRMFIWAHNEHIKKGKSKYITRMGWFLSKHMENKYYSIGFVFNQGSFQSCIPDKSQKTGYKLGVTKLPIYKKNTLTNELSKLNENSFFINIRDINNSFFSRTSKSYVVGAVFYKKKWSSFDINPKKEYDGLIYLSNTSRAVPVDSLGKRI